LNLENEMVTKNKEKNELIEKFNAIKDRIKLTANNKSKIISWVFSFFISLSLVSGVIFLWIIMKKLGFDSLASIIIVLLLGGSSIFVIFKKIRIFLKNKLYNYYIKKYQKLIELPDLT